MCRYKKAVKNVTAEQMRNGTTGTNNTSGPRVFAAFLIAFCFDFFRTYCRLMMLILTLQKLTQYTDYKLRNNKDYIKYLLIIVPGYFANLL